MDVLTTRKSALCLVLSLPLFFSASYAHAEGEQVGVASYVIRDVQSANDKNIVRKINLRDAVFHNEVITTTANSSAQLLFPDETSLTIGPSSELRIDSMVFDPEGDNGSLSIDVTAGVFHFISGHLPKTAYALKTPSMAIGIRGTVFDLVVETNGETTVVLQEGALQIATGMGDIMTLDVPGLSTTTQVNVPAPTPPAPPSPKVMQRIEQVNNPAVVAAMPAANQGGGTTKEEVATTSDTTAAAATLAEVVVPVDSQTISEVSDDSVTLSHNTHNEPL